MESLKTLYLEYCKTYNVDAQECVKSELKRLSLSSDETSYMLNLSSHHLTEKTCMIISKLLVNDQKFTGLLLNDCNLSNEALRDICNSLTKNSCVRILELKGNNIHSEGTEHLARLLRHNSTIRSLSLEWNSLGLMSTNAFSQFCESLSMNKSLKDLDLRNNQITHTSATELCSAIETNNTLETFDLRWNNIGLVGGKRLLAALKKNYTLTQLLIVGNNIPDDIVDAINLKIYHNGEQSKTVKEYNSRASLLANELQAVQMQKDKQVNVLLSKIDLQEEAVRKTNRTMAEKMKKLQTALEDRMSTMTAITSKMSIADADLALCQQKCADLEHTLQKANMDKDNEIMLLNNKFKREKEELLNERFKLERELNDLSQRYAQLEEKLKDQERKCQEYQTTAYEAKEKLAQGQAEYQIKALVLEEESKRSKQKQRDELKDFELNKSKDIERLKDDFEITEKNYRERINKLESNKHFLEDEISKLKASLANSKISYEQQLHEFKTKYVSEEDLRRKEIEDRCKTVQGSKEDLINENSKMNAKIVDLQQKSASQTLEIETLKRNNDSLRNQIHEKELYIIEMSEKSKTDYEKRLKTIQKDIDRLDEYKSAIQDLEMKLKKTEAENQINYKNYQMESEHLKIKVKTLEDIVRRFKEEDEIRNAKAQAMLKEYFKPSAVLNSLNQI